MIVVTANWAIPDGSVAAPPRDDVFTRLVDDLRLAAVRAGFRRDGRYEPIERLVLVLAGDTFDCLVSDRWLDGVRPWERRRQAVTLHGEVLRLAWERGRRPLAAVARLARRGVDVPTSDVHGRPILAARVAVPVHVAVLQGDRDAVVERFARGVLARRGRFAVGQVWEADGLRVAHGSESDPLAACAGEPSLLESLAVDLLARFGVVLLMRPALAERGRRIVRELADGQPLDMPLRLKKVLATADDAAAGWIADAWRRSVDRWEREARRWGCGGGHGEVSAVAAWMHAMGSDPEPVGGLATMIAVLSAPLPPGGRSPHGDGRMVLGHATCLDGESAGRVVCLGPRSMRPCGESLPGSAHSGSVACVETGPGFRLARLPAVAVLEGDEGGGHAPGWYPMWDTGVVPVGRTTSAPILDAA